MDNRELFDEVAGTYKREVIKFDFDCKPKPKRDGTSKPTSRGTFRDDPPDYNRPIYDRDGNQIGTIYDAPPMPGPSGLS
jgi:rRNA processing protein Gar1